MISENTLTGLMAIINLREADSQQRQRYIDSFKNETKFIQILNEFIPLSIVIASAKNELTSIYNEGKANAESDRQLSLFYKKHNLKRDIHNINDTITYIIIPSISELSGSINEGFIDIKLLNSLCKYQGRPYKATDQTLKAIGQRMGSTILQPTNYWLEQLPFYTYHKEPERYWQVAGSFKQYTWGKLFMPQHKDKKVFLTVGIDLKEQCLFYGLDCLRAGSSKLSTEQILMFDHFTKDKKTITKLPLKNLESVTWKTLIEASSSFLVELEPLYSEVVDYIWYNHVEIEHIAHQLIKVKPDASLASKKGISTNGDVQETAINLVVDYERDSLEFSGKSNLASAIKTLGNDEGSNVYDVHSFNTDGSDKYIKVIGSANNSISGFQLRDVDINRSLNNPDKSYLYTVLNLSTKNKSGHLLVKKGPYDSSLKLKPIIYSIE